MMKLSGKYKSKVESIGLVDFNAKRIARQEFFEMKRKIEITLETENTIILRQVEKKFMAFCPQCEALVEMITPPVAAAFFNLSEREIFRHIENGRLHFVEAERIFVCQDSLIIFGRA